MLSPCLDSWSLAGGSCSFAGASTRCNHQQPACSSHIDGQYSSHGSFSLSWHGKRLLVVQLWIPEHMGHLYGFLYHRIWCFGRSFTIWDQSSLMLLHWSAVKRSVYVDIADFMSMLLPATTWGKGRKLERRVSNVTNLLCSILVGSCRFPNWRCTSMTREIPGNK